MIVVEPCNDRKILPKGRQYINIYIYMDRVRHWVVGVIQLQDGNCSLFPLCFDEFGSLVVYQTNQ